jgi:probable F420-dependent oxidoreductase
MVYYEPLGTLAFLAGCTQRIRLGTNVLVLPYRHPVVTAKQLATIDTLSGGRVFIGVGAGWMEEEFRILGSPPYAERGAVTDEYIEVFRTLWREPVAQFEGKYVRFPPLGARPQPAQRPGIPILVGGNTRPAIRRAVRLGDGWQPLNLTPDQLREALAYLHGQAKKAGRVLDGFEVSLNINLRMTDGPTERRAGEEHPDLVVVGPASEVRQRLRAYEGIGVTEVVFGLRTCANEDEIRQSVRLCGEQVVQAAV